jgi:hypothetical protein
MDNRDNCRSIDKVGERWRSWYDGIIQYHVKLPVVSIHFIYVVELWKYPPVSH